MTDTRLSMKNLTFNSRYAMAATTLSLLLAVACSSPPKDERSATRATGITYVVRDTTIQAVIEISGTAAPLRQATLSTKLMGTVLQVLVNEGDRVAAGQTLARIDARDLAARNSQAAAAIAEAEAVRRDAATQEARIRALYADSAATRAQLDAVETGLIRADAAVRSARASSAELAAVSAYSAITAPFGGIVTKRFVDPGAFAAPGSPLIAIQDGEQLRIAASTTPEVASTIHRGEQLEAFVEDQVASAIVEGIVPSQTGNLYVINALVANARGNFLPGSTATLRVPSGSRRALLIPSHAVVREGDLTGVTIRSRDGDELRWVRLGQVVGALTEVSSGLRAGESIVVPDGSRQVGARG
jgi:RND family efflux transporter MFP subunit